MTEENRKQQEKQDELSEKDLDKASGGAPRNASERPAREKYEYNKNH